MADAKTAKSAPGLLDHAPVKRALGDPATRYWLRDLLISARSRDPVDTLADLDTARDLLASYLARLSRPIFTAHRQANRPMAVRPSGNILPPLAACAELSIRARPSPG